MMLLQVASVITLLGGEAATPVRNASLEPLTVTVELRARTVEAGVVRVGQPIHALVTPAAFRLDPGEQQLVRVRLREVVAPGTTLAFVVTLTPETTAPAPGSDTAPVARLVFVTRLIAKVLVR